MTKLLGDTNNESLLPSQNVYYDERRLVIQGLKDYRKKAKCMIS